MPRGNKRVMNLRIRETLRPVSGTNSEEDDRGLTTKNENTFRWMPSSNILRHILCSTESRPTRIHPFLTVWLNQNVISSRTNRQRQSRLSDAPRSQLDGVSPYRSVFGNLPAPRRVIPKPQRRREISRTSAGLYPLTVHLRSATGMMPVCHTGWKPMFQQFSRPKIGSWL